MTADGRAAALLLHAGGGWGGRALFLSFLAGLFSTHMIWEFVVGHTFSQHASLLAWSLDFASLLSRSVRLSSGCAGGFILQQLIFSCGEADNSSRFIYYFFLLDQSSKEGRKSQNKLGRICSCSCSCRYVVCMCNKFHIGGQI